MKRKTQLVSVHKMNESLSKSAYDTILKRILGNSLPAGELINRRTIAAELGISVAPVLEALLMLERDGLLETLPRKGTRVTVIRREDIAGHLYLREALECHMARQICGQVVTDALPELITLAQSVDTAPAQSLTYIRADIAFHTALVSLCQNNLLMKEYERIAQLGLFYRINRFVSVDEAGGRKSHRKLLEQLETDDPDYARRCMRDHIVSGKGDLIISRA
jgi:DNA-binding GntR family transcriptional regulator